MPKMSSPKAPEMSPIVVTVKGVEELLSHLNPAKANGPDGLHPRIMKELALEISPVVADIFSRSLTKGVPDDWRETNVVPIYKKGDKTKPENYRPVSLTSICSKMMEHIIVSNIHNHLDAQGILTDAQHGFRSNRSCETQLLLTAHDIAAAYSDKVQLDMVLLDFSKAFDKVPHDRLLAKLHHYGIRGETSAWIGSFLKNRTQSVPLEGERSALAWVTSGVPKGSVLGPLLFLLYINDLPEHVRSRVRLFVDDSTLYREIRSREDQMALQQHLVELEKWEKEWQMSFNPSKCSLFRFSPTRKAKEFAYKIHDTKLEQCHTHKYLGVLISDDYKWSEHIDRVAKKANHSLGFVQRNTHGCSRHFKEGAYKSLVRPHLEYCSSVWDPHTQTDIAKLERVQRRGARYAMSDHRRTSSVTSMIGELGWEDLAPGEQLVV